MFDCIIIDFTILQGQKGLVLDHPFHSPLFIVLLLLFMNWSFKIFLSRSSYLLHGYEQESHLTYILLFIVIWVLLYIIYCDNFFFWKKKAKYNLSAMSNENKTKKKTKRGNWKLKKLGQVRWEILQTAKELFESRGQFVKLVTWSTKIFFYAQLDLASFSTIVTAPLISFLLCSFLFHFYPSFHFFLSVSYVSH